MHDTLLRFQKIEKYKHILSIFEPEIENSLSIFEPVFQHEYSYKKNMYLKRINVRAD